MNIRYTREAIADLVRLREFIGEKNPIAARRVAAELLSGIDKLRTFPLIGIPVSRAPKPELIRDLFIGQYTVRYLVDSESVTVLRLWHDKETGRSDQADST